MDGGASIARAKSTRAASFAFVVGGLLFAHAAGASPPEPHLAATACEHRCAIAVDGHLDDPVWQQAPSADHFSQLSPNPGAPASERTSVRVAYDTETLYIALLATDEAPTHVVAHLGRRDDEASSDWLAVYIDSYADQRSAFEFAVSAAGGKLDAIWSNDSERDLSWDAVWRARVARRPDGWSAELAIPLSQLRFDEATPRWGFQVRRVIQRKSETSYWAPVPPGDNRMVSRFGSLDGLAHLPAHHAAEVAPYLLASSERDAKRLEHGLSAGVDGKLALTSNLTLDAALNPDFGQVEADPAQLNLTALETYYLERRPFFVAGQSFLKFGVGVDGTDLGLDSLYYSRRIGAAPPEPDLAADETLRTMPASSRIYGATKLSGKSQRGLSIGLLEAVTAPANATITNETTGTERDVLVAARTSYSGVRLQQDLRDGRTVVGGMVTEVVRDPKDADALLLARRATTGGLDVRHRFAHDQAEAIVRIAASDLRGSEDAIADIATSPTHLFQRPGASHLTLDPTRRELSGYAASYHVGKTGGAPYRYGAFGVLRSPGFDSNDMGYLQTADFVLNGLWAGYYHFTPSPALRLWQIQSNGWYATTYGGEQVSAGGNASFLVERPSGAQLYAGLGYELESYDVHRLWGGPALRLGDQRYAWVGFITDPRRALKSQLDVSYILAGDGSRYASLVPTLRWQASSQLLLSLAGTYVHHLDQRQYVEPNVVVDPEAYYVSRLNRHTLSVTARADWALTPELTVQLYTEAYLSAGRYGDTRVVTTDGHAATFDEQFRRLGDPELAALDFDPAFHYDSWRSNLVLRWEYRPGSLVYLVWAQGRTLERYRGGTLHANTELSRLFDTAPEDVVMIKLSLWAST